MVDTYAQLPDPEVQYCDGNGDPLSGGKIYTYAADGVTPKDTWQDPMGNAINPNPITLGSDGRAPIWGDGDYVFAVYDSLGNHIETNATATANAQLGISAAMFPVVQAASTAAALALLGGQPAGVNEIAGVIKMFAAYAAPAGYLLCYGQEVSRVTYASLFTTIGTLYGAGNGTTTFNVPDMRGRIIVGWDSAGGVPAGRVTVGTSGIDASIIAGSGGNENSQNHTHFLNDPGHVHGLSNIVINTGAPTGNSFGAFNNNLTIDNPTTNAAATGATIAAYGGGNSQNMPPALVMNYIISTGGV